MVQILLMGLAMTSAATILILLEPSRPDFNGSAEENASDIILFKTKQHA